MSHFKVKSKLSMADMKVGDIIKESDFCTIDDGNMVQLEYIDEEEKATPYIVKPGIWSIIKSLGFKLEHTSFVADRILDDLVNTKSISDKIGCFFRNLQMYKKFGIEVPRRALLLYGPAGTGKTSSIIKVANQYAHDGKTAVLIWPTDKYEAHAVKDFIKTFEYNGVDKVILIVEDIGGIEVDQQRRPSDSSLLSLLDNKEKIFTIPIFTIATTNFPENFLGNLTNRPGRFDDKIEVGYPDADARTKLLQFYLKEFDYPVDVLETIRSNKYKKFSAAHIQEIVIRSSIYEISLQESMDLIAKEIVHYENMFANKQTLGIKSMGVDYD